MRAKFFPKQQYPVQICQHRDGKDLTITEQTDTLYPISRYPIEYYGYKHNVRAGAYLGNHYGSDSLDIEAIERIGNIRSDVYMNVGAVAPSYAEAVAIIIPWFRSLTAGRYPSAVSFAAGNTNLAPFTINDFIGGRNSFIDQSNYAPYNRAVWSNLASTTRWFDFSMSWEQVADVITAVANTNGWYRNFTHWHNLSSNLIVYKQGEFYHTINSTLASIGKKAHCCSAGEAIEYAMFRDLITRTAFYQSVNGKLRIAVEVDNLFLQNRLNTPVSIKIDLTGTIYQGKDIASINCEIISLGANQFIVNVPFRLDTEVNKIIIVELEETTTPDYRHFNRPLGTTTQVENSLNISTDSKTMVTLFSKAKSDAEEKYYLAGRSLTLSKLHSFSNLDFIARDYKAGISDKYGNLNIL